MKCLHSVRLMLVAVLVAVFVCACSEQPKEHISSLLFDEALTTAYLGDSEFTGTAWSEDERTICINCEAGKVTSVVLYHGNGTVAMESKSLTGAGATYDEDGNAIALEEFVKKYPVQIKAVQDMAESIMILTDAK